MPDPRAIYAELKRRHVVRAGVLYIGAIWALAQGIAQIGPAFGMPDWGTRWFVIAGAVGFPFWVALAWLYELTPQGLKRESEMTPEDRTARSNSRTLDYWIIAVMSVAIVLLVTNQFVLRRDATSNATAADTKAAMTALASVPVQSVAVLPFANESGDATQDYFSDGLSEELISCLTQIDGLKVIGKYSSFRFRGSRDSPAHIGAALGVANLIQGSVRQQRDRIRVTIGMIHAADGSSVWSHSYDGQLNDVFAIQSQIGRAVAEALQIKLLGKAITSDERPPGGNVEAYQLMLQGRALTRRNSKTELAQGVALLEKAVQIDREYAFAWSALSNAWLNLGVTYLSGVDRERAYLQARSAADKASELAPDQPATHITRGYVRARLDENPMGALAEYRRALALAPSDGTAMSFLAFQYGVVGQLKQAADLYRGAIATNPLRADWYVILSYMLSAQGHLDQADQAVRKAIALQPDMSGAHQQLAAVGILRGDAVAAMHDAEREPDPDARALAIAEVKQISGDIEAADAALHTYVANYGDAVPYYVASLYAIRKQPDKMFEWLERAWAQRDPNLAGLLADPFTLAYKDDARFIALCRKIGLPAPSPGAAGAAAGASSRDAT